MTEKKVIHCLMPIPHHFLWEMRLLSRRKKRSWPKDWYFKIYCFFFFLEPFLIGAQYHTRLLHQYVYACMCLSVIFLKCAVIVSASLDTHIEENLDLFSLFSCLLFVKKNQLK